MPDVEALVGEAGVAAEKVLAGVLAATGVTIKLVCASVDPTGAPVLGAGLATCWSVDGSTSEFPRHPNKGVHAHSASKIDLLRLTRRICVLGVD